MAGQQQLKKSELTPEEEVMLQQHFKECLAIGTCTDPANRKQAEETITEMYKLAGHKPPEFEWFQSPASACVSYTQVKFKTRLEEALQKKLDAIIAQRFPSSDAGKVAAKGRRKAKSKA